MTEIFLLDLERRINNNFFKSKSDLITYIEKIRKNPGIDMDLFNKRVEELLLIYDKNHESELPLDMNNYKDVKMQDSNYIVSSDDDKVLKTNGNHGELSIEFKKIQNEIVANNKEGSVNADTVFNHMERYQKESSNLMPLSNLNMEVVDKEMLDKIRFFIKSGNVNVFEYQVDISNGVFFNINTNELFEVRRNPSTNNFEIFKGSEAQYNSETVRDNNGSDIKVTDDIASLTDEELMEYQENKSISFEKKKLIEAELAKRKNKPKTRVLRLDPLSGNRAAFIKSSFLFIVITMSFIICALLLLFLK